MLRKERENVNWKADTPTEKLPILQNTKTKAGELHCPFLAMFSYLKRKIHTTRIPGASCGKKERQNTAIMIPLQGTSGLVGSLYNKDTLDPKASFS